LTDRATGFLARSHLWCKHWRRWWQKMSNPGPLVESLTTGPKPRLYFYSLNIKNKQVIRTRDKDTTIIMYLHIWSSLLSCDVKSRSQST